MLKKRGRGKHSGIVKESIHTEEDSSKKKAEVDPIDEETPSDVDDEKAGEVKHGKR